jgi:hypothetical protein
MRFSAPFASNGRLFLFVLISIFHLQLSAQDSLSVKKPAATHSEKKWYETLQLRGYTQVRYNRLLETNPDLKCEQCDRYWGDNNGIGIRRLRLVLYGNVHERVYVYIQPDFASAPSTTALHYGQIRDAYFDLSLDKKSEYRLRFGQSKVPFGFENMQSSQNRTPLDRNDALNSAVTNERDMALFFYWAPKAIRERFSWLIKSGLKGSGDYGVVGLGVYNGQTANRPEANNNMHTVARISYPFKLKSGQIIEPGIQGYTGKTSLLSVTKEVKGTDKFIYDDSRVAASLVVYPQPFGLMAEYNIGTGPEYNPENNTIEQRKLQGGYVQAQYLLKKGKQVFIPFTRYQYYHGGKKAELDARMYRVKELEIGLEWQPFKNFELVAMYTISDRTFQDAVLKDNRQTGNLLRLQAQFNY